MKTLLVLLALSTIGVSWQDVQETPNCITGSLTQVVTPASFEAVPGQTVFSGILIENHNPKGCPATGVILTAESAKPVIWNVVLEGGAKWVIEPQATAFTRLHIAVPREATVGSVVVNYTLDQPGMEPIVIPILVTVTAPSM